MMDAEHMQDDHDDQMEGIAPDLIGGEDEDEDEPRDAGDEGEHDCDDPPEQSGLGGVGASGLGEPRAFAGLDEASAMALFSNYHNLGSYMVSLNGRLKTMLNNIKPTADPTTRLVTLQELSELLSISTEDTLAGSFPINSFVRVLIQILGGSGRPTGDDEDGEDDEGGEEQDEDAALAAAIALSGGTQYAGDENLEAQVLAARCLANLMEALPGIANTVSYHGAIPVLCSKLTEISYIDLAEQVLSVSNQHRLLTLFSHSAVDS
jgi:E3 ubiquitin-protein ligase TRIP12